MLRSRSDKRSSEEPVMNLKRTVTIVAIGGALLAWLAGAATSNREIAPPPITRAAPIEARGAELATEVARLHDRLRPTATPRMPGRNLFTFHAASVRSAHTPAIDAPARPALVETPAPLAQPTLKLAGIAEDAG